MKKRLLVGLVAGLFFVGMVGVASATFITSNSDASLSGGDVIDFAGQTLGSYTSLNVNNVTFNGNQDLRISDIYAGNYNTSGYYLDNGSDGFSSITFDFTVEVDAFGFNWGASDYSWTLSAYDNSGTLLETYTMPITSSSNNGDFYGISASAISYAELKLTSNSDWVMIDNFTTAGNAPVPEPATMLLFGTGLVGLVGMRRRKNKK